MPQKCYYKPNLRKWKSKIRLVWLLSFFNTKKLSSFLASLAKTFLVFFFECSFFFCSLIQACLILEPQKNTTKVYFFFFFRHSFYWTKTSSFSFFFLTSLIKGGLKNKNGEKVRKLLLFCYFVVVVSLRVKRGPWCKSVDF